MRDNFDFGCPISGFGGIIPGKVAIYLREMGRLKR